MPAGAGPRQLCWVLRWWPSRELRAWLDASQAQLAAMLTVTSSFPEQAIAETSKGSLGQAVQVMERAATLESTPAIAAALDRGAVTAGHVDAITRGRQDLRTHPQRDELLGRVDALVDVAEHASAGGVRSSGA